MLSQYTRSGFTIMIMSEITATETRSPIVDMTLRIVCCGVDSMLKRSLNTRESDVGTSEAIVRIAAKSLLRSRQMSSSM